MTSAASFAIAEIDRLANAAACPGACFDLLQAVCSLRGSLQRPFLSDAGDSFSTLLFLAAALCSARPTAGHHDAFQKSLTDSVRTDRMAATPTSTLSTPVVTRKASEGVGGNLAEKLHPLMPGHLKVRDTASNGSRGKGQRVLGTLMAIAQAVNQAGPTVSEAACTAASWSSNLRSTRVKGGRRGGITFPAMPWPPEEELV